ncbi:MAG: type II toxin-antitoxin system HicB family antitoxin [Calditrichaeota bacterium]|nr:type II toxin-antitoxin system HicB family antitoxin [Calditrichota bacterium]
MSPDFVLSHYIDRAMSHAAYDKLDNGTFTGEIDLCPGVYAFGKSLRECADTLRSVLEGWILLGLKMNHPLPVIDGVDLNQQAEFEPLESLQTA